MVSYLDPPYTSPTRGFYMSLHACSMHKPWAKTMVLCTWFYTFVYYEYWIRKGNIQNLKHSVVALVVSQLFPIFEGQGSNLACSPLYALTYFWALVLFTIVALVVSQLFPIFEVQGSNLACSPLYALTYFWALVLFTLHVQMFNLIFVILI